MKINKIIHQHRRDFTALYECERCGHISDGTLDDLDQCAKGFVDYVLA